MISFLVMVATMTIVTSLWIMISTVTATVTRLMSVVMTLVMVVAMMAVIKNRTQRDKRNRRSNDAMVMICTDRCADQCQGNQAANGHGLKHV